MSKSTGPHWGVATALGRFSLRMSKERAKKVAAKFKGRIIRTAKATGSGRKRPWSGCGGRKLKQRTRLERIAAAFGKGYGVRGCVAVKVAHPENPDILRIEIRKDGFTLGELHDFATPAGAREHGRWFWGWHKRLKYETPAF